MHRGRFSAMLMENVLKNFFSNFFSVISRKVSEFKLGKYFEHHAFLHKKEGMKSERRKKRLSEKMWNHKKVLKLLLLNVLLCVK